MIGQVIAVSPENVVGETAKMKVEGYRFVTLSCVEIDETTVDILYHFDRAFQLKHLRLTVPKEAPVPSISPVYFAAFLVENEIQDLFGIRFQGLVIDYDRTLYLDEDVKQTPFCKYVVIKTAPLREVPGENAS
ncbi:MAG: NADH-quinone oxidoreductase subunit C [Pseudomonadota bacterium]